MSDSDLPRGFGKTNFLRSGLELLSFAIDDRTIEAVHDPIEAAIAATERRIDALPKESNDESEIAWGETVTEEGCALIEELLGVGFVVVQTYLTTVKSAAKKLSDLHKRERGTNLSFVRNGIDLLRQQNPKVAGTGYFEIEVLNAIANYWKHREEWDPNWDTLEGKSKMTADRIRTLGASFGSSGNLRVMASAIGMTGSYSDFQLVREKARRWAGDLYGLAEDEIGGSPK
jgi:hypothetical protein